MRQVVIISNPQDSHTRHIVKLLSQSDIDLVLLFPEMFGQRLSASIMIDPINLCIYFRSRDFEINEAYSIWYRRPRPQPPKFLGFESATVEGLDFARNEWETLTDAIYALATKPKWVSHPDKIRIAARKPMQLAKASQLGLKVPHTLITNDPQQALEFYHFHQGKVIIKSVGGGQVFSQSGKPRMIFTNRLEEEDLVMKEAIRVAPITFQEEIRKAYEIRVTVVGKKVFSVRINSQQSTISELDWRRYDFSNTPYSPYELPDEISKKCLELTKSFGLEYGAIDLIRSVDGDYIFLEINPNGQFLWAEKLSGVQISEALVKLLIGEESDS